MSFTSLGKRQHKLKRFNEGAWVDGEYVTGADLEVTIFANIQPASLTYISKMLIEGEKEKEMIAIFSNHWVYPARSGDEPLTADIILYRGSEWKVVNSKPFGNFGQHCEAIAVKLNDVNVTRVEGLIGVIN